MTAIFLILTAAFAVLTWADLHKGLFLLVAVLPSYLLRTDIFGIPTTLLELFIVAFLLIWTIKFLGSHRLQPATNHSTERRLKPATTSLTIFFILLVATISILVAPDMTSALGVWKAYFLEPILLFFVVRYELEHGEVKGSRLFEALGLCAIVLSLIAIFQWLTGMGLPIPWDIEHRVTSVFDYPNALGLFLGPIVIIAVMSLRKVRGIRLFWLLVTILSSIAIILAQSEAALVSIVATLFIAGLIHRKTRMLSSGLLVLLILLVLLFPPILSKLTLQDYSGSVRLSQWTETTDMLRDHWFLGAGLSGYPTVFEPYHQATYLEIFQYPHNIFLNIWVELGLLGLVAFALLAMSVIRKVAPRLKPGATTFPPFHLSILPFLALLQMTIHGLVDVPYFKNDLAILTWILLAIIFAYARHTPSLSKTS